jgi:hypothetical protein
VEFVAGIQILVWEPSWETNLAAKGESLQELLLGALLLCVLGAVIVLVRRKRKIRQSEEMAEIPTSYAQMTPASTQYSHLPLNSTVPQTSTSRRSQVVDKYDLDFTEIELEKEIGEGYSSFLLQILALSGLSLLVTHKMNLVIFKNFVRTEVWCRFCKVKNHLKWE